MAIAFVRTTERFRGQRLHLFPLQPRLQLALQLVLQLALQLAHLLDVAARTIATVSPHGREGADGIYANPFLQAAAMLGVTRLLQIVRSASASSSFLIH